MFCILSLKLVNGNHNWHSSNDPFSEGQSMSRTIKMNTYYNIIDLLCGLHLPADWSVVITFCRVLRSANIRHFFRYLPLFAPRWPLNWPLAPSYLPPRTNRAGGNRNFVQNIVKHTCVCGKSKYIAIYMIDPFVRGQTVKSFAWTPCYCGELLPTKDIKELSTGYLTNSTIMLGSSGFWLLLFGWGFCLELLPAYTMTW